MAAGLNALGFVQPFDLGTLCPLVVLAIKYAWRGRLRVFHLLFASRSKPLKFWRCFRVIADRSKELK